MPDNLSKPIIIITPGEMEGFDYANPPEHINLTSRNYIIASTPALYTLIEAALQQANDSPTIAHGDANNCNRLNAN